MMWLFRIVFWLEKHSPDQWMAFKAVREAIKRIMRMK